MISKPETVVIVGAGQAAAAAAVALREFGHGGDIVMIGEETEFPYERPELSKGFLEGSMPFSRLQMLDADGMSRHKIDFRPDTKALEIDLEKKTVATTGSDLVAYDQLILATGGVAATIDGCLSLRTRVDAEHLRTSLQGGAKVGVLGAGWLGLELAALANATGLVTTIHDPANSVCERVLPQDVGQKIKDIHEGAGIRIHLGTMPNVETVKQDNDLVIACVGLVANDNIAQQAGLEVDRGILVNERQRTSILDVFAIGDCAKPRCGPRAESWAYANISAKRAAAAICGCEEEPSGPLWFWSKQGKTLIQMVGSVDPEFDVECETITEDSLIWRYHAEGTLKGAIALNSPRGFNRIRRAFE